MLAVDALLGNIPPKIQLHGPRGRFEPCRWLVPSISVLATVLGVGLGLLAPSVAGLDSGGHEHALGERPVSVRLQLRGGEQLAFIAEQYGTTEARLRTANPGKLARGRVLEVFTARLPSPRQQLRISSRKADTWDSIAARYFVTAQHVRRWNPRAGRRPRPREGTPLVLWVRSGVRRYPLPDTLPDDPAIKFPSHGESIGRPHRGRIEQAAKLPPGPYVIRFAWQSFGSAGAVWNVQRALAAFVAETGYDRDVFVGALSRRTGRRLPPHRSHQSGRDVDIRLPDMPYAKRFRLQPGEVDWHAAWALVDAFVRTGDVQVIFLERKLRGHLRRAGLALGASDTRLKQTMGVVHHSPGHTSHIHIRFRCNELETRCRG